MEFNKNEIITVVITLGQRLFEQRGPIKKLIKILQILSSKSTSTQRRLQHLRIQKYEAVICSYLHEDFKSHFRMSRNTLELLIQLCETNCNRKPIGRPDIPFKLQCLVCIWVLANQESYRSIADRFNITKSTVFHCLMRICKIINQKGSIFITWPQGEAAVDVIESFRRKKSFPGVLGAIDGCHISIRPPKENSFAYINRKGRSSMLLQAVCDSNCIFTDCFIGFPGSVHDSRVFHCSTVFKKFNANEYFPENSHLLGDSAYPLSERLLTPYRDNGHLSRQEVNYNKRHASTRSVIERAFGCLKARWRRLNYLELHNTNNLPIVISAACMLHNICIRQRDDIPLEVIQIRVDDIGAEVDEPHIARNNREGIAKRNYIMNIL